METPKLPDYDDYDLDADMADEGGDYCECSAMHGTEELDCGICSACGKLVD